MTFEYVEESTSETDDYTEMHFRERALKLAVQVVEINANAGRPVPRGWMYDRADDFLAYIKTGAHPVPSATVKLGLED